MESLKTLSIAASDIEDCKNCIECEDLTTCIVSMRKGIALLAKCMTGLMMSVYSINNVLMKFMEKDAKKKNYDGFYV